jgi:hypothetical protein
MAVFAVRKALADWVASVLGLTAGHVMWNDQDNPKPSKPFVKLKLSAYHPIGWPVILPPDGTGKAIVVTQNDFTFSILHFADPTRDSIVELLNLQNALWQEDKLSILRAARIAFRSVLMGPTDACQMVDTSWESRGAMDLLMSCPYSTEDTQQGFITSNEIEGVLKNGSVTIDQISIDISTPSIT